MAVSGADFLAWAKAADDKPLSSSEIDARNCVSRAYYASYHMARWLGDELAPAPDEVRGSHRKLCYQLKNSRRPGDSAEQAKEIRRIGYILDQQREMRTKADYRLDLDFPASNSAQSIRHAEVIETVASSLESDAA